jgi:hypothetical protein
MTAMNVQKSRVLALLMEQDSYFTEYGLRREYEEAFASPVDEAEFKKIVSQLTGNDTLIGFDVEEDGLDGVLIDHNEHGPLESSDYSIIGADTYLAMGPAFPVALHQNLSAVSEAAADGGLSESLRLISLLPVDSSQWTGLPTGFRFTPEMQNKVVDILQKAHRQVSTLGLTNAEAAKATAYIDCALMMAQLPEPEPDLVALLVKRLLVVVGAIGFFADLKGIFS